MSEEPLPEKIDTYYVKMEVGRHVPDDNGFYATFNHKEIVTGLDSLQESIDITVNLTKDYLKRTTKEK